MENAQNKALTLEEAARLDYLAGKSRLRIIHHLTQGYGVKRSTAEEVLARTIRAHKRSAGLDEFSRDFS